MPTPDRKQADGNDATAHQTRIAWCGVPTGDGYRACCSCGWMSTPTPIRAVAVVDADKHVKEARSQQPKRQSQPRSAHYVDDGMDEEDNAGFLSATCACGWRCPPCPDEETRIDFLMQHAYEAGILTERGRRADA